MKRRMAVLLVFGMLPWAGPYAGAGEQTAQTQFQVTATVNAVCAVTATDLNFTAYTSNTAGPLEGSTSLSVTCSPNQTYNIGLNAGQNAATVNQRKMKITGGGAQTLDYQLYSDTTRQTIWGNTSGTDTVAGLGTGAAVPHTVFGQIPPKQVIPAGAYTDTIQVTVYY